MEVFQGLDVLLRRLVFFIFLVLSLTIRFQLHRRRPRGPPACSCPADQVVPIHPRHPPALSLLALLLELAPTTTFPEIESDLLPDVYRIARSPLVSGAALDSLLSFCSALVSADHQIATHLVPNLVIGVEKAPRADASPKNVAETVAQIVRSQEAITAGAIAQYAKKIKVPNILSFAFV
jgi:cullin-associated NEDD8-dissociated protein 1